MLRVCLIVLCSILFLGCSWFSDDVVIDNSDTITHPQEPRPVTIGSYAWMVEEVDGKIYIGLTYDQFIDYMKDQEDVLRYIKESNAIICFYKTHFDEESVLCLEQNKNNK